MIEILQKYILGDMECCYLLDSETRNVELMLIPAGMEILPWEQKKQAVDSLIQVKKTGDTYPGGYAGGNTMRQSVTTALLTFDEQHVEENERQIAVHTWMNDSEGCRARHCLVWPKGSRHLECYTEFMNEGADAVCLEMLSSFSLGGITPFTAGDAYDSLLVHRIRSVWSMEGRLESRTMEELQLEPSWAGHAVRSERFGQAGSMPVNHYFPWLVIEDSRNDVFWGAQIMHNASWQMEVYRKDDGVAVSGGLADREFGHWMKSISPKESFTTPVAILSVAKGNGVDGIAQRMTSALETYVDAGPACEQELPIVFNEYCTTWGCPSHENIKGILDVVKNRGFSYFVIDCGWYKKEGIPWDIMMGDYDVSKELFPEGLDQTVQMIKDANMKAGIWFEIENVGEAASQYQNTEHLLKRDGKVLTTTMRRFFDMRDPWVEEYLTDKVIGTLLKCGFEYMKVDYNDTIGIGCDGAESLGEGLRQNMSASLAFIEKVKRSVPGIVLENCASGGHRLEPLMMSRMSMASFSDAHECEEIPVIAANLHRVILPRQSQIWAVIRKEDSLKRVAYSVANTFLGRMCISGDVMALNEEQWGIIDSGIAFYKKIADIIKKGTTFFYGTRPGSYRHLKGWQGILRVSGQNRAYALFHIFTKEEDVVRIPLPNLKKWRIMDSYSYGAYEVFMEENEGESQICYRVREEKEAVAVILEQVG